VRESCSFINTLWGRLKKNSTTKFNSYSIKMIIFVLLLIWNQPSSAFLRVKGKEIVDTNGQSVLLRGYGLGGWLVPEGYMLHTSGFGSPTDIKNKIQNLIGEENAKEFYRRYVNNYVAEKDIEMIANWGFNSIRIPFNYRDFTTEEPSNIYLDDGFELLDKLLNWCEKNKIYLILDMHCAPGGQSAANISDSDGLEARLWTEPDNQDLIVSIWEELAARYVNKEWIGGYDLINEPVLPSGYSNQHLRDLSFRLARAIRKIDTNHIIYIEGNWYATDFTLLTPPFDVNMAYSHHKYWSKTNLNTIQYLIDIRNEFRVPLWLGETGENSNQWFHNNVKLHEDNNIGWNWWTHKKIETTTSPYTTLITNEYQEVLDYWNGTGGKPSKEFATAALFEMADNLAIDNCIYHPDVIDALTRDDFNINAIPYKSHHIPGIINCVDYDMGGNGVAYFDLDYQNIGGSTWNRGWQYRNDGVDIEMSETTLGTEYTVGWIEGGEWLSYTVETLQSGNYEIFAVVSSPNTNGKLNLLLNSEKLTETISVPNTGGWSNWQKIKLGNLHMSKGINTLKLNFINGDFNLNKVEFILKDLKNENTIGGAIIAKENFPNPFSSKTTIPLIALNDSDVKVDLFDVQGRHVKTLFDTRISIGEYKIEWDGTDNQERRVSSGVYFYQIECNGDRFNKSILYLK
jgi:endoglucanase